MCYDNKQEVVVFSQIEYLYKVDIFKISFMFSFNLLPYLRMQTLTEGEMIYRKDDSSEEVFFLLNGDICLVDKYCNVILKIKEGSTFGEIEVIENTLRQDFCQCMSTCLILFVDKERFMEEISKEDYLQEEIKEIVKKKNQLILEARMKIIEEMNRNKLSGEDQSNIFMKRDSISGQINNIEKEKLKQSIIPSSERHYFLFLKAYNQYKSKMTKQKQNEEKEDEEEEKDKEDEIEKEEEIKMEEEIEREDEVTSKVQFNRQQSMGPLKFSQFIKPKQINNTHKNSISDMFSPQVNKEEGVSPPSIFSSTQQLNKQNVKQDVLPQQIGTTSEGEEEDDFNLQPKLTQANEIKHIKSNLFYAKLQKIKKNMEVIYELKDQYYQLVKEVNLKKNILISYNKTDANTKFIQP